MTENPVFKKLKKIKFPLFPALISYQHSFQQPVENTVFKLR